MSGRKNLAASPSVTPREPPEDCECREADDSVGGAFDSALEGVSEIVSRLQLGLFDRVHEMDVASLHHEMHLAEFLAVHERIAGHGDDVGEFARLYAAKLLPFAQQDGR